MRSSEPYRIVVVIIPGIAAPYVMQDLASAFVSLGHDIFLLDLRVLDTLPTAETKIAFFDEIRTAILQFDPHFVVGYNSSVFISLPPNDPEKHFFEALRIPYVSLFYDNPMLTGFLEAMMTPASSLYTVFIWDRYYLDCFREKVRTEAFFLPLAANPEVFNPPSSSISYCFDVGFVGSVSEDTDYKALRQRAGWHDWLMWFATHVVETQWRNPQFPVEKIIETLVETFPQQTRDIFEAYYRSPASNDFMLSIYQQLGDVYRLKMISALCEFRPAVFGGKGWQKLGSDVVDWRGAIAYGPELADVYRRTRINLNISSVQLIKSANQRVFDVPAAGAFLLTDEKPGLEELFSIGEEIITYRTMDELREKVAYYLAHDSERKEIADNARRRVMASHTYIDRANRIIDVLRGKGLF